MIAWLSRFWEPTLRPASSRFQVIHIHLKGWNRAQHKGCAPGDDDIGLDQVAQTVCDGGYQGVYSLEYEVDHNPDAELQRSRRWLLGCWRDRRPKEKG